MLFRKLMKNGIMNTNDFYDRYNELIKANNQINLLVFFIFMIAELNNLS